MILHPSPVSSDRFHWSAENGYVAEISDLGIGLGRVFDDACDEGLTLVSRRSGRSVAFVVDTTMRVDGEVVGWHLVPVFDTDRNGPATSMTIFND